MAADSESESKPESESVGVGRLVRGRSRSRFFEVGESAQIASTPQADCGVGVKPGVGVGRCWQSIFLGRNRSWSSQNVSTPQP